MTLSVEYGDDMKQLFSGMKRLEAANNQSSTPKSLGKQPLTFSLYNELCQSTRALAPHYQWQEKLNTPCPHSRRKPRHGAAHIGYETLKLKPSKHKRSEQQLKLATVLRLIRDRGRERGRVLPFKERKRLKQSAAT
ncbi:unnamed protein product [Phytophthora lilii]|uniref:Unnamed protein product n=1 Tax=Phytophthora lilii TaxID=2077276 RepID=A0A9W6X7J7_9STRA|nr:unnamed protein product [Phytophthora lilii]